VLFEGGCPTDLNLISEWEIRIEESVKISEKRVFFIRQVSGFNFLSELTKQDSPGSIRVGFVLSDSAPKESDSLITRHRIAMKHRKAAKMEYRSM